MPESILTTRDLNRTHLHRQHLLKRSSMSTGDMLRAIVGLQAQEVKDPYLALWSRLAAFQHDDLASMLLDRSAVRASLMRGTIHLVTSDDYQMLFPATFGLHKRALPHLAFGKQVPRDQYEAILEKSREFLQQKPATMAQIADYLEADWPEIDRRAIGQVSRFLMPLVQIPPRGVWGAGIAATWTPASDWLGVAITEEVGPPHEMIRRYLAAFGPATLADVTSWSGVTNLKKPMLELGDELIKYRNEAGVLLYDLAGKEIVPPDVTVPVRFLPGFDNALLGHKDRSRIISDTHRAMIGTPNGLFASTFLVDGFVAGVWRVFDGQLQLAAFNPLPTPDRLEVEQEAASMAPFWTGENLPVVWTDLWKLPGR